MRRGIWVTVSTLSFLGLSLIVGGSPALADFDCTGISETNNTTLVTLPVVTGLSAPLFVTSPPGDVNRLFILEQNTGLIKIKKRSDPPGTTTTFLNVFTKLSTGGERGLLSMAFDPDYATNGFFYLLYTRAGDGDEIIARYSRNSVNPDLADLGSENVLLRIDDPASNHNGGALHFGADGYLYASIGDGGGGGDGWGQCGNGQNRQALLGKMLRIAPNATTGNVPDCGLDPDSYRIPADNPFANGPGGNCDEIWAYGLRNPFRFSIDAGNGDIYTGDVGQDCWEEISWAPGTSGGGENYGWRQFEGKHCYAPAIAGCTNDTSVAGCCIGVSCGAPPTCAGAGCVATPACSDPAPTGDPLPNGTVLPIHEYAAVGTFSVIGGNVYRGCRMPNIRGTYFWTDYYLAEIRSFVVSGGAATNHSLWFDLGANVAAFGEDAQGEVYIVQQFPGTVHKLAPPLPNLEVSGAGATPFLLGPATWTWENLALTSMHPITGYNVYRAHVADGHFDPGEIFNCIFQTSGLSWAGGDPDEPAVNTLFAYVVVARNASGQLSSPGGNPPRTLGACP